MLLCAALGPLGWGLQQWAAAYPARVEELYSRGVYPVVARHLGRLSGLVPFSLAEAAIALAAVLVAASLVRSVRAWRAGRAPWRLALAALLRIAAAAGLLYAAYVGLWGLNHQRLAFATVTGWDRSPPTVDELDRVCAELAAEVQRTRPGLPEDGHGVFAMPHDEALLESLARAALAAAAPLHPSLAERASSAKRPVASPLLSSWWISGVYSPWTGEAHVNRELPDVQLAFTTCHELAHGLGFAREDEANLIAILACLRSDDPVLGYSGAWSGLRYVLRALATADPERAAARMAELGDGFRRDDAAARAFWASRKGATTNVARHVNDRYLRSQGQRDGALSYGRVVDLLVAEQRARAPVEEHP